MQAIERDVYLVAMLQQQKLVANGEAMVDKICKCLHLPDVGFLRKYAAQTEVLDDGIDLRATCIDPV